MLRAPRARAPRRCRCAAARRAWGRAGRPRRGREQRLQQEAVLAAPFHQAAAHSDCGMAARPAATQPSKVAAKNIRSAKFKAVTRTASQGKQCNLAIALGPTPAARRTSKRPSMATHQRLLAPRSIACSQPRAPGNIKSPVYARNAVRGRRHRKGTETIDGCMQIRMTSVAPGCLDGHAG